MQGDVPNHLLLLGQLVSGPDSSCGISSSTDCGSARRGSPASAGYGSYCSPFSNNSGASTTSGAEALGARFSHCAGQVMSVPDAGGDPGTTPDSDVAFSRYDGTALWPVRVYNVQFVSPPLLLVGFTVSLRSSAARSLDAGVRVCQDRDHSRTRGNFDGFEVPRGVGDSIIWMCGQYTPRMDIMRDTGCCEHLSDRIGLPGH